MSRNTLKKNRIMTSTSTSTGGGGGSGTVTSVGSGTGLTGGPITTSGSLSVDPTVVEFIANKSSDVNADQASTTKYSTVKALFDWAIGLFVQKNANITGATKTKITYDSKGLVTAGTDATTADIADSLNKRYVTDAQLTVIGNTSGTNSGNETTTSTGNLINSATDKTTPVDADYVGLMDSAASNILKKLSWANIKATLKTYFDGIYQPISTSQGTQYTTYLGIVQLSPAASTTYYFGSNLKNVLSTGAGNQRIYLPKGGTINRCYVFFQGGISSNQNSSIYLRLNNTTDNLITSSLNLSIATPNVFNNTSMGMAVTAGDYIEVKWVTPAWTSSPTNMFLTVNFVVE